MVLSAAPRRVRAVFDGTARCGSDRRTRSGPRHFLLNKRRPGRLAQSSTKIVPKTPAPGGSSRERADRSLEEPVRDSSRTLRQEIRKPVTSKRLSDFCEPNVEQLQPSHSSTPRSRATSTATHRPHAVALLFPACNDAKHNKNDADPRACARAGDARRRTDGHGGHGHGFWKKAARQGAAGVQG